MKQKLTLNQFFFLNLFLISGNFTFAQSGTENYIHTINPLVPVQTSGNVSLLSPALRLDEISYLDGIGRTVQQVYPVSSPSNKDLVNFVDYDNSGRVPRSYLAFTDIITNGNTGPLPFGLYRPSPITTQQTFYSTAKTKFKTNTTAFSDVKYDDSPLGIVKESSAPASAWDIISGKTNKQDYRFNSPNTILLWKPAANGALCGNGTTPAYYAAKELLETVSLNEDNIEVKSYYDKSGKLITTAVKASIIPLTYHYTYYVYNDFDELVCVIPPAAIDNIVLNSNYATLNTYDYLFLYEYDSRGRVVKSKKPNQGWNYFIYDKLNQLVFTQNEKMLASNQFMFYKYDVVGRPILSGTYTNSIGAAALQTQVTAASSPLFESRSASTNWQGYTNLALPTSNMEILTVNYYDDYDFNNDGVADVNPDLTPIQGYRAFCTTSECQEKIQNPPILVSNQTKGLLTGSRTKILEPTNPNPWLSSASYYDEKGQVVQSYSDNYGGGFDVNSVSYDFSGKVTYAKTEHHAYANAPIIITYRFLYDKIGRLHKLFQKINEDPVVLINQNKYNEIGQLVVKNIHSTNCLNFLQSIDYTYNELGWPTHMNNADLNNGGTANNNDDTDDLFGYELKYEAPVTGNGTIPSKFDGTISEVHWKSYSDANKKAYGCNYDLMNRLHHARYNDHNSSGPIWIQNGNYDEYDINYDPNGNITSLKRNGWRQDNSLNPIDLLSYQYNGNQLTHVNEASALQGYNDFKPMSGNYVYDVNGNLSFDPGKNMSITYNHLDLPVQVITTWGSMEFVYDANGTLLARSIAACPPPCKPNGAVYTYLNGFTYYNGVLQYFDQPEGRVVPNPIVGATTQFLNEYSLTDHLGNPRVNFCDANNNGLLEPNASEVLQENHYYPYGLDMYGLNKTQVGPVNKEKFNGAELYDEIGMNLYNFGPRTYDAALGRWSSIDPMADLQPGWSPYRFGFDNPMNFNDPSGLYEDNGTIADVYDFSGGSSGMGPAGNGDKGKWYHDGKGNNVENYKYSGSHPGKGWKQATNVNYTDGNYRYHGYSDGTTKQTPIRSASESGASGVAKDYAKGVGNQTKEVAGNMVGAVVGLLTGETYVNIVDEAKSAITNVFNVYRNAMDRDMETADWDQINDNINDAKIYVTAATAGDWGKRTVSAAIFFVSLKSGVTKNVAKRGTNIVGTTYDAVKPTQDWINPAKVTEYKSLLRNGKKLDPIITYKNSKGVFIEDGHHRFAAYMQMGIKPNMILRNTGGPVGYSNWLNTTFQVPPLGH